MIVAWRDAFHNSHNGKAYLDDGHHHEGDCCGCDGDAPRHQGNSHVTGAHSNDEGGGNHEGGGNRMRNVLVVGVAGSCCGSPRGIWAGMGTLRHLCYSDHGHLLNNDHHYGNIHFHGNDHRGSSGHCLHGTTEGHSCIVGISYCSDGASFVRVSSWTHCGSSDSWWVCGGLGPCPVVRQLG